MSSGELLVYERRPYTPFDRARQVIAADGNGEDTETALEQPEFEIGGVEPADSLTVE